MIVDGLKFSGCHFEEKNIKIKLHQNFCSGFILCHWTIFTRAGNFKPLWSPESIGINSASLCSMAARYDNPIPTRCLAPIDFLKIPALHPPLIRCRKNSPRCTCHWRLSELFLGSMASGTIMGYIGSRQKTETSSLHRVSTRFFRLSIH
jgi:hypothetical protein